MKKNTKEYLFMLHQLEEDLANNEITLEQFEELAQDYKTIFNV